MPRHKRNRSLQHKAAAPSVAARTWFPAWAGLLLISLLTCLVYLPALNGGLLWDDNAHITRPELQSLRGLYRIWFDLGATQQYYPLLHSAFWLEHELWGDSVLGYHLITLFWHVLAVVLVYFILKKLRIPGAFLAAAIFGLHPVMVVSVAWMSEQKNTLSAVFYLSAMLAYLEFDDSRRRTHYLMALGLFVLGLLTKTVTATMPAALLVILWWQRGTLSWKRDIAPLVPFFLLGAVAGIFTAWVERKLIGAEGAAFDLTFVQRGLLAGRVVWFYLSKLLWPAKLTFIYPRWEIDAGVWWQWLFPIGLLGVSLALWGIHKRWRGPLAGWLLFVGTLVPVLGFLNVYPFIFSFVADHFQYLASLGIIVLAASGIARGLALLQPNGRLAGVSLCALLVGTLAVLSWRQSRMYADGVTLYQTTIDRNPDCWMAHNNLGSELLAQGHQQAAMKHFQTALRINPDYAEAHNNLGNALIKAGRYSQAIDELHVALKLAPDFPVALNNLGIAHVRSGRYSEAIEPLERAIRLRPSYAEPHNNLGVALAGIDKIPQAIEQFRQAAQLDPYDVDAHNNLGVLLAASGDSEEAVVHLQQALRLRPDLAETHSYLGDVLLKTGRPQQAIEHYQAALRLDPNFVQAYANLARALSLLDRAEDAIATAQRGIEVCHSKGRKEEAEKIEQWLTHYQVELRRTSDAASPPKSPPP
jgi:tetratricopeptide (TPR) repeat protein